MGLLISKRNLELSSGFFWIKYPVSNICSIISIHEEDDKVYFLGDNKPVHRMELIKMENKGEIEILAKQTIPAILLNKHFQN